MKMLETQDLAVLTRASPPKEPIQVFMLVARMRAAGFVPCDPGHDARDLRALWAEMRMFGRLQILMLGREKARELYRRKT